MPQYEALIKITDNINDDLTKEEQDAKLWKSGDIVVVKEKGWMWGREEKKKFLIIGLPEMTFEEAQALQRPIRIQSENGSDIQTKLIRRARFRVNIDKFINGIDNKEDVFDQSKSTQPLRSIPFCRTDFEDKMDTKDVKQAIEKVKTEKKLWQQ